MYEVLNKSLKNKTEIKALFHRTLCTFFCRSPLRRCVACGECYSHIICHGCLRAVWGKSFGGGEERKPCRSIVPEDAFFPSPSRALVIVRHHDDGAIPDREDLRPWDADLLLALFNLNLNYGKPQPLLSGSRSKSHRLTFRKGGLGAVSALLKASPKSTHPCF